MRLRCKHETETKLTTSLFGLAKDYRDGITMSTLVLYVSMLIPGLSVLTIKGHFTSKMLIMKVIFKITLIILQHSKCHQAALAEQKHQFSWYL